MTDEHLHHLSERSDAEMQRLDALSHVEALLAQAQRAEALTRRAVHLALSRYGDECATVENVAAIIFEARSAK